MIPRRKIYQYSFSGRIGCIGGQIAFHPRVDLDELEDSSQVLFQLLILIILPSRLDMLFIQSMGFSRNVPLQSAGNLKNLRKGRARDVKDLIS